MKSSKAHPKYDLLVDRTIKLSHIQTSGPPSKEESCSKDVPAHVHQCGLEFQFDHNLGIENALNT